MNTTLTFIEQAMHKTVYADVALTKAAADDLTQETLQLWRDHVNAGFLGYRKSMGDGEANARLDWVDEGSCVIADARGETFLDCLSGFGVFNVGHRNPEVVAAVQAQLHKQPLHSQEFLDPLRAYAAAALARLTALPKVFFVNSGAEAVEAALKLAIAHTGRYRVLACLNGFHGKTMGALATTSKALFRAPFVPALMDVTHVPFNDVGALTAAMDAAAFTGAPFAAFIVEPVQGEGGIHVATAEYLAAARAACSSHGTALIFDEIQCGLGRTGTMFASQAAGVLPDLMCVGKSLSGGVVPVAACCGTDAMWAPYVQSPFLFTTTFGGSPLACAAILATLKVLLRDDLCTAAAARGAQLLEGLTSIAARYPTVIKQVRGRGLMLGVEAVDNAKGVALACGLLRERVLVSGTLISATTIRVCPPLVVRPEEIEKALTAFDRVCRGLA